MSNVLTKLQKKGIIVSLLTSHLLPSANVLVKEAKDVHAAWRKLHEDRVKEAFPFLSLEQGKILLQSHSAVTLTNAVVVKDKDNSSKEPPVHGSFYSEPRNRTRDYLAFISMRDALAGSGLELKFSDHESRYTSTAKWYQDQSFPGVIHLRQICLPMYLLSTGEWPKPPEQGTDWVFVASFLAVRSKELSQKIGHLYEQARATFEDVEQVLAGINTYARLEELFPEAAKVCPNKPEKVKTIVDVEAINKVRKSLKTK